MNTFCVDVETPFQPSMITNEEVEERKKKKKDERETHTQMILQILLKRLEVDHKFKREAKENKIINTK